MTGGSALFRCLNNAANFFITLTSDRPFREDAEKSRGEKKSKEKEGGLV